MEEYGIFEVIEKLDEQAPDGHKLWRIRCKECGREFIRGSNLVKAPSKITYNCFHKRITGQDVKYDNHWKNLRIMQIYYKIITRCYNKNNKDYCSYGAKGISVYQDWLDNPTHFEDWALANGYEDNLTIDRRDETKDYCPSNCRWITKEENSRWKSTTNRINVDGDYTPDNCRFVSQKVQANNRRNNRFLTYNGKTHTISEWSKITGIPYGTLSGRILCGWQEKRAIEEPVKKKNKKC